MGIAMTILQRDATILPRRRWFYLKRMAFAGIGGAVIVIGLLIATASGSTTVGLQIFESFSTTVLLATCILSALTSGLALVREKRDRTLGLLFLTDMSCMQQIQGRYIAGISLMLLTVCSLFPMFVLSASLGGISPIQIAAVFTVLVGMIFLGCSIGTLAAAICRTERTMVFCGGLIAAVIFLGIPLAVISLTDPSQQAGTTNWLHVVSSFVVMGSLSRGQMIRYGLFNCLFNIALSLPLLLCTGSILPKAIFREASAPRGLRTLVARIRAAVGAPARSYKPMPLKHAVAARDIRFVHGGYRQEAIVCLIVSTILGGIAYAISASLGGDSVASLITACSSIAAMNTIIFGLATVLRGARSIRRENENQTMPLLLSTSLSDSEVVWGKLWAVLISTSPWFIIAMTCGVLAAALTWEFSALLVALASGAYVLSTVFAITCLAMLLSLWFNTPALLGICFPAFLLWNSMVKWQLVMASAVVGMLITSLAGALGEGLVPVVMAFAFFTTAIAPDAGVGLLCIHILKKTLRKKAIRN